MKILILSSNNIFSGILLRQLIKRVPRQIVGLFLLKQPMYRKNYWSLFNLVRKKSGWRYALYLSNEAILTHAISQFKKLLYPYQQPLLPKTLCQKYCIPVYQTDSVLNEESLKIIRRLKPDLIISARFSQIIKQPILKIPRLGVINFHGSMLPQYAGLGSIFQALYHQESYIGITIHFVNEEIDEGKIITQEKIKIMPNDSVSQTYLNCYDRGANLIVKAVTMVKAGSQGHLYSKSEQTNYFSWPDKIKIKEFKKKGGKFLKISDLRTFWHYLNTQNKTSDQESNQQQKKQVADFYENCAPTWDQRFSRSQATEHFMRKRLNLLKKLAQFNGQESVLEIGCGTAFHLINLAKFFKTGVGTDIAPTMIKIAQEHNQQLGLENFENLKFVIDDAETLLQFADNSFDIIFFTGLIEHLINPIECLQSAKRVLKKGGYLIGLTTNKYSPWYYLIGPIARGKMKHMDIDQRYSYKDISKMLAQTDFLKPEFHYWGFVPAGKVPPIIYYPLTTIERWAEKTFLKYLAGGIAFKAVK